MTKKIFSLFICLWFFCGCLLVISANENQGQNTTYAKILEALVVPVPELSWQITSIDFGWKTETVKDFLEKIEDENIKESMTNLDASGRSSVKLYGEAEARIGAGLRGEGTLSPNILRAFESGITVSGYAEGSSKLGAVASGEVNWQQQNQDRARQLNSIMSSINQRIKANEPFLDFSLIFINTGDGEYDCQNLQIPVKLGSKIICYAQCYESEVSRDFTIPPNRPQGIPVRFRAPLENSGALELLKGMETESPLFRLENSRGKIISKQTGGDIISTMQLTQDKTYSVTIRMDNLSPITWRILREIPNTLLNSQRVTLLMAMEAINKRVQTLTGSSTPIFSIQSGLLTSIAGVDNGFEKWWHINVDGQNVPLDMSLKLGTNIEFLLSTEMPIFSQAYMESIRKQAQSNDAYAQVLYGFCFTCGIAVSKNDREAIKWYRLAAEQGYADAQYSLGLYYANGCGVILDHQEAVKWYRLAAKQGHANAQINLGVCHEQGIGITKDEREAVKWYRLAAKQGYAKAQHNLGVSYDNGRGVVKDERKAVKWYRLAAEQGNAGAQCNLGVCYDNGRGVDKDEREAVKWWRMAAEQGDPIAQHNLGVYHENGCGVAKDTREAIKWYRLAAEQGLADAQFSIGMAYYHGRGVDKEEREAVKWYRMAAEQEYATAQYYLGQCYLNGYGVAKDEREAVKWWHLAAEQGNAGAQHNLGVSYVNGCGVAKDEREAAKWWRMAAEQGLADAQFSIGMAYYHGCGVTKDEREAAKWLRLAEEQENADINELLKPWGKFLKRWETR